MDSLVWESQQNIFKSSSFFSRHILDWNFVALSLSLWLAACPPVGVKWKVRCKGWEGKRKITEQWFRGGEVTYNTMSTHCCWLPGKWLRNKDSISRWTANQPTSRHSGEDEDEKGNEGSLYPKEIYPLLLGNVAFVFIPRCHWLDLKSVDSGFIVQSVILSGISRRMIIIVSISYQCTAPHPLAQQAPALAMRMTKGFLNRSRRRTREGLLRNLSAGWLTGARCRISSSSSPLRLSVPLKPS